MNIKKMNIQKKKNNKNLKRKKNQNQKIVK